MAQGAEAPAAAVVAAVAAEETLWEIPIEAGNMGMMMTTPKMTLTRNRRWILQEGRALDRRLANHMVAKMVAKVASIPE